MEWGVLAEICGRSGRCAIGITAGLVWVLGQFVCDSDAGHYLLRGCTEALLCSLDVLCICNQSGF